VEALSDAEVIGRSIDSPQCFATLFDRHAGVVFRFLVRRVGRDAADELLGDTFRIAVEGGAVKYSKNGSVFYTSSSQATYALRVHAVFFSATPSPSSRTPSARSSSSTRGRS